MTGQVPDEPVALNALTFLDEDGEVTVGCPDTGAYIVLPGDGAELLRRLAAGLTQRQAADWYRQAYGEPVDVGDFVAGLGEAGFLRSGGEAAVSGPVRWQRLGAAVFSPAGGACLAGLLITWLVLMTRHRAFVPGYQQFFFTRYLTLIEAVTFLGQFPLLLIHESAHALAGRRLGLRTSLSVGRRLYYLVFETAMDGLVAVERRRRYLPMLAGMLADLAVCAILTIIADLTLDAAGQPSLAGRIALALSLATLLRIVWQFYFYLQTDLYYVVVTVLRCVDLQTVARELLADRFRRLLRRSGPRADPSRWHPRDRAVAAWYSWLLLAGYAFSIGTLVAVAGPAAVRMASLAVGAVRSGPAARVADVCVFITLNLAQFLIVGYVALRSRRQRRAPEPAT